MQIAAHASALGQRLPMEETLRSQFMDAATQGVQLGKQTAAATPRPDRTTSRTLTLTSVQHLFPDAAQAQADLAYSRSLATRRTADGVVAANWLSDRAEADMVERALADYERLAGPTQARVAAAQLEQIVDWARNLSRGAKRTYLRDRPFKVDPKLPVVIQPPKDDNLSFPSGHATTAFAAAAVLAALMPERRGEFLETAAQVAFSRICGGVHFVTDVLAGATLGSTAAAAGLAWLASGTELPPARFDLLADARHAAISA